MSQMLTPPLENRMSTAAPAQRKLGVSLHKPISRSRGSSFSNQGLKPAELKEAALNYEVMRKQHGLTMYT